MGPLRIHGYKGQQLLNDLILYSLTALACTSFCSSPLWYPPFSATFNVFFFFSLPKLTSFFFTTKALFIVGNLIVIFLLGESKFFASKSKAFGDHCQPQLISMNLLETKPCEEHDEDEFFESYNDEETCEYHVDKSNESSSHEEEEEEEEELSCLKNDSKVVVEEKQEGLDLEGDIEVSLPPEELNKLVDDFIARIIRQRRLEAEFCRT